MNELFNALLDISKLDAGVLAPDATDFPIAHLLARIETTFAGAAREKGLSLRVVPSSAWVRSDVILLERILLNLVVQRGALHVADGGVVVGCRRRGGQLRIEVWDSGHGIPEDQRRRHLRRSSTSWPRRTGSACRPGPRPCHRRPPVPAARPSDRADLDGRARARVSPCPCRARRPPGAGHPAPNGRRHRQRSARRQARRRDRRRRAGARGHGRPAAQLGMPRRHRRLARRGTGRCSPRTRAGRT